MPPIKNAVLLIAFNRPDKAMEVLRAIKKVKPCRLYLAVDGPRLGNDRDVENCQKVKEIIRDVDWPCQIFYKFSSVNRGCKLGVSEAITWFFDHEEQGIILEDDVVASKDFFYYCDELLHRYRNEKSIGLICGVNFIEKFDNNHSSYFFSKYSHIWGWATWRRVWESYDVNMSDWPQMRVSPAFKSKIAQTNRGREYWLNIFDKTYNNKIDTWDYQLIYSCLKNNLLSVIPSNNLVLNIGFGSDATHTVGVAPRHVVRMQTLKLTFPLVHPEEIKASQSLDLKILDAVFLSDSVLVTKLKNHWYFIKRKLNEYIFG